MSKRRTFGSVRRLPSGRWQASFHHPVTHHRVTGPTTYATKREATTWLALAEADLVRGDDLDPNGRSRLFRPYAEEWLAAKLELRPKTVELYAMILRKHLLPAFGDYPLALIDRAMVRRWYVTKTDGPWANATVAKMYRLLRQIMQAAVDDRIIRDNPCRIGGAATERSDERLIPTVDEVRRLADAIDPRYRAMVIVAAFAGLRRSECLGLARRHVDLDGTPPMLQVERQNVWTDQGGYRLGPPKTNAGHRRLALPGLVVDELADHLAEYVSSDSPDALLFTTPDGTTPTPTMWRVRWARGRADAGVDCTFHDLRHVAGTLNAQAGATLKEAMRRLGHSSAVAALRYQHAVDERDAEIADAVGGLIGRSLNGGGRDRARSARELERPKPDGDGNPLV
ncbi:MAG: tyrosine-type recombinase/integrase [Acidimicrobiales bacterium]